MEHAGSRKVRLEIAVSEDWLAAVLPQAGSPSEFAEFVLENADTEELLNAFPGRKPRHETVTAVSEALAKRTLAQEESEKSQAHRRVEPASPPNQTWSSGDFNRFLTELVKSREFRYPLALLTAYVASGPSPTSETLKRTCGFPAGDPAWDQVWHQELRAAKARITIQARRKGLPSLFLQPSTTASGDRVHPLDPAVFEPLKAWASQHGNELPDPSTWGPEIGESPKYANSFLKHRR